jgi:hypothetical protein
MATIEGSVKVMDTLKRYIHEEEMKDHDDDKARLLLEDHMSVSRATRYGHPLKQVKAEINDPDVIKIAKRLRLNVS